MEFKIKVLKNKKVIFFTETMKFMSEEGISEFIKEFKSCIQKDCTIIAHKIEVKDGVVIKNIEDSLNELQKS